MQPNLSRQPDVRRHDTWSHAVLGDHNFRAATGLFAWWYQHTAPSDPPAGATFQQRDLVRRGRIASAIMLFLACILLLVAPIGFFGPNKQIFVTALIVWVVIAISLVLNRKGKVNLVGLFLCLSVNVGMYLSILRAPGGMGLDDKDILYLLVFAELFIGAILPINWVFVPLIINVFFSIFELTVAPHTPQFAVLLPGSLPTIVFRVVQMHVLVTGVIWILGMHAREAIKRADRAEEVARLQHDMSQLAAARAQDAQRQQTVIDTLTTTLNQIARGDLHARVPLTENTFWTLSGTLNNLLSRYQRARLAEEELQQLRSQLAAQASTHPQQTPLQQVSFGKDERHDPRYL